MSLTVFIGCCRTATLTILLFRMISWIWTGPYTVVATWPLTAVSPADSLPARLPIGNSPGTVAGDDEAADVPPVLPVPPVVDTAAEGAVGRWDLNDSRATRPAMVPTIVRITRRISRLLPSELERFAVDAALGHPGGAERRDRRLGHAVRPADVDVLLDKTRGEGAQHPGRQRVAAELGPRPDYVVHDRPARGRDRVQLVGEDDVLRAARAVDQRDPPGQGREHGAQRRDADPAGQQHDTAAGTGTGERAVRPLGDHAGARLQPGQRPAVVTEIFHRDPQHVLPGCGGQRVR